MNLLAIAQLLLGVIDAHHQAGQPAPPEATAGLAKILGYYTDLSQLIAGLKPPSSVANIEGDMVSILGALKAKNITIPGAQPVLDEIDKVTASLHNLDSGQWAEAFEFTKNGRVGVAGAMFKDGPAYKSITE